MHECLFRGFSWHVEPIRFPAGLLFNMITGLVWSWLCGNLQAKNLQEYIKHHPTMDIVDLSQRVTNGRGRGCEASGTLSTLLTSSGRMYSRVPGPICFLSIVARIYCYQVVSFGAQSPGSTPLSNHEGGLCHVRSASNTCALKTMWFSGLGPGRDFGIEPFAFSRQRHDAGGSWRCDARCCVGIGEGLTSDVIA